MTQNINAANAILMGGGSGGPAWKFETEGAHKTGTIVEPPTARQERDYDPNNPGDGPLRFFKSGDPIMGILATVQTDERDDPEDDGKRTFYIEGKRLKDAVRAAVKAAGSNGLEVGGVLDVTLTHYDTPGDRRSGRNWAITYTPPTVAALNDNGNVEAPAAQNTGQDGVDKVKQLVKLGLDDTAIAAATGLDTTVVATIRAVS